MDVQLFFPYFLAISKFCGKLTACIYPEQANTEGMNYVDFQ